MQKILHRRLALMLLLVIVPAVGGAILAQPARAQTAGVTIQNFAFIPPTLTVPVGTTVTWTNMDTTAHTSTSDTGLWNTPLLQPGQSASVMFSQAGTFAYHCSVHPFMHGTIVVQAATGATPTATSSAAGATATATSSVASATATPTRTSIPMSAVHVATAHVLAKEVNNKYVFAPNKITVKVGQFLTWKNTTDAGHTVTSTAKGWSYNRKLGQGKSLSSSFSKTGTYHYKCLYHPGMVGTVIVTH